MSYNYITTIKPEIGMEHTVPRLLREYLKKNYNIVTPEDFGLQGSIPIPGTEDEYLCLFCSSNDDTLGHLIVFEGPKVKGWRTEFSIYGDLTATCTNCTETQDTNFKFCPKCGNKLTYSF